MPVPEHVSVDNSHDSSSDPSLSPVTFDSSSISARKKLFQDFCLSEIPCRTINEENAPNFQEYDIFIKEKTEEILSCLRGELFGQDEGIEEVRAIDLWHLRQLALSRGGLINSNLRKQAWLKLVDSNEKILLTSSTVPLNNTHLAVEVVPSATFNFTTLSDREINLIKHDIENCIWNIEAEIKRSFSNKDSFKKDLRQSVEDDTSLISFESASGHLYMPATKPASRASSAILPQCDNSIATVGGSPVLKPGPIYVRRKGEERSLLLNIITSILRTSPDELKLIGMERLFYFPGMQNILAPILITLQSPSLTSLTFKQLSQYHLKDAMSQTYDDIEATIRSILLPLLEHFDKPLYDLLFQCEMNDPCSFALRWVLSWFASDISDYDIISRLFDAFLVSHYTFPIYTAVAVLTFEPNRAKIEDAARKGGDDLLTETLFTLPKSIAKYGNGFDALAAIELIIQSSVSYFQEMPPQKLLKIGKDSKNHFVTSSVHVLETSRHRPIWTYQPNTYSDWSIIQEAKLLRSLPPELLKSREQRRHEILHRLERNMDASTAFELARIVCNDGSTMIDATNMHGNDNILYSRQRFMILALVFSWTLLAFVYNYIYHLHFSSGGTGGAELSSTNHKIALLLPINSIAMNAINQWEAAKAYVEQDPDLFVIFL